MQALLNEQIKILVSEINKKLAEHEADAKSLIQARISLQNICKHQFEPSFRDHSDRYEKCIYCQFNRRME